MPTMEDFLDARAMRANPQYAEYLMRDQRSDPANVAQSFATMEEFLKKKGLARKATFEQQAKQNFRAPQSLESMPQYQEESPLAQWKERLSAMMQSGNPVLQKQALGEMQEQQKQAFAAPAEPKRSSAAQMALDMGLQPGTPEFVKFVRDYAMKSGTTVNVGGAQEKPISTSDLEKLMDRDRNPIPFGTTPSQAREMGATLRDSISGDSAGKLAMMNTAQNEFSVIDDLLYDTGGKVNNSLVTQMWAIEKAPITSAVLSTEAGKLYAAFETGMQAITRTETGAAMAKEEIGNVKKRFMPMPYDDQEVQQQKIKAFKFFINNATELLDPLNRENQGLSPAEIANRAANKSLNEVKNAQVAPKKGDVKDGYEFLGGDPNDKNSWRKK